MFLSLPLYFNMLFGVEQIHKIFICGALTWFTLLYLYSVGTLTADFKDFWSCRNHSKIDKPMHVLSEVQTCSSFLFNLFYMNFKLDRDYTLIFLLLLLDRVDEILMCVIFFKSLLMRGNHTCISSSKTKYGSNNRYIYLLEEPHTIPISLHYIEYIYTN